MGALKDLGVAVEEDWANSRMVVHGCGGTFPAKARPAADA